MYKRKFYRQKHNRLDLDPTTIITPEAMPEYGYGGASRDKLEGSFPVVRKRIEDFFEKLEKQGVGTAACVHTATFGGSEGEGKEIDFFDDEDEDKIEKSKVYLLPGEKPPEGIQVMRGPRGGLYYESSMAEEPSLTQENLKQRGWHLEDYQKKWLSEGQATLEEIPIDKCQQWEYDPPLVESNKRVQEMALSLKQGYRLPVIETYRSKDGGYVVADGQHRLMAYKALGHKTIPAMVTAEEKVKEAPHKLEESLSGKIAQKAARLEPKFSGIITNIAEATGGDLYKFEFRQKDQQGIDRKIKEIKESHPELSEEEAAEQVADYLRYTIVYSCEEYGKKVISAQNKLKEMGFDFYDHKLRKYFGEGPYKGYNTVMQDSEGNVFELQFHTHKSLERLDKVRPLYEKFRVEQDNHAKGQLYLQMMQGWEGFVLPSDIEMLAGVMM